MSVFTHRDVCRYICGYLDLNDICMFRRCNKRLRIIISGKFFYDRKTDYLLKLPLTPSEIMGVTRDGGYRRYCKQKGWRATCPEYKFAWLTHLKDPQFVRYLLRTKDIHSASGISLNHLIRTKDRVIIDLTMKLVAQDRLWIILDEILVTQDEELIIWFEEKYLGDKLEQVIIDGRGYDSIQKRYRSQYCHCFAPVADPTTGRYCGEDIILALQRGTLHLRVHKSHLNIDTYMEWCFRCYGYIEEGDYYVKRN